MFLLQNKFLKNYWELFFFSFFSYSGGGITDLHGKNKIISP